jgi:hypothetical protein
MNYFLITYGPIVVGIAISLALNRKYNWNIYTLIAMTTVFVWASYVMTPVILQLQLMSKNSRETNIENIRMIAFNAIYSVPLVLLKSPYYIVFLLLLKTFNFV